MTTQPLTKSDWDGHPVWWVRHRNDPANEAMVTQIWESGLSVSGWSTTRHWGYWMHHERSHDRITWEPCSREVKEPPLQLREGAWYERRDGEIVGPMQRRSPDGGMYQWHVKGIGSWTVEGKGFGILYPDGHDYDLIREVPPPQPDTVTSEMLALQAKVARYEAAINWACGRAVYDDFSPPEDAKKKPYWWRGGLTKRAKLRYDCARQKYVSQDDAPQPDTVDVEKLIELVQLIRKRNISGWINRFTLDKDLAALHPRLKEEVER